MIIDTAITLPHVAHNGLDTILASILSVRNIADPEAFLNPKTYAYPNVPFSKLDLGVERIEHAIKDKEWITVWGDFDMDGMSATALLVQAIHTLGGNVNYVVPHRIIHGHGLDKTILDSLIKRDPLGDGPDGILKGSTELLLTCDCGTNDTALIQYAWSLGMDVIVSDHHVQIDTPLDTDKVIVINPTHLGDAQANPFHGLAGVGVAYLIGRQLFRNAGRAAEAEHLLDLVALGTIGDMVPLTELNRALLYRGLPLLWSGRRLGVRAILDLEKIRPFPHDTEPVAFLLAPMFNAAGRLESAAIGIDLLLESDPKKAEIKALKLKSLNDERKFALQQLVLDVENNLTNIDKNAPLLIVPHDNFHSGLIGLAANRLAQIYSKPVMLIAVDRENHTARASVRGFGGKYNIIEILKEFSHMFGKFGGHGGAGGFIIAPSKIDEFKKKCLRYVDGLGIDADKVLYYDTELDWSTFEVDLRPGGIVDSVECMAPFGMGNPRPVFMSRNLAIGGVRPLGDGTHAIYSLVDGNGVAHDAYWWRHSDLAVRDPANDNGATYDIAYTLSREYFAGRLTARMTLVGIRACAHE